MLSTVFLGSQARQKSIPMTTGSNNRAFLRAIFQSKREKRRDAEERSLPTSCPFAYQ